LSGYGRCFPQVFKGRNALHEMNLNLTAIDGASATIGVLPLLFMLLMVYFVYRASAKL